MYSALYVKTDYSLLSSMIKIDNLITYLKKYNISSCAIVDDNLFYVMEAYKKFTNASLKLIVGLEVKLDDDVLLLYAKNENGYKNLIKIECLKNNKELSFDVLRLYNEDILCVVTCDLYYKYKDVYNDIFIGVCNKNEEYKALEFTKDVVFLKKTLYLEKYEYKYLPYLFMIRDGKTISDGLDFIYQDNYLYDYNEIVNFVGIDTLNNTLKLADMCNISFEKNLYMPKYDVVDSKEYLINLSNKGLSRRLNGNVDEVYQKRLNYELDIIIKMHFEDYFLVVYDYIKYAKKNGILVGPGRGSAAGSLVSYSLGITDVDPIKYDLLFERFLNPERITMPDIDTDFPDVDRDKVIDYVREKYGNDKTAGIITFGTLGAKQAVRDVGRVLNIDSRDIDYICKRIGFKDSLKDLKLRDKDINSLINSSEKLKLLYNIVLLIENNKRHTSIHAAGIVISRVPLNEVVPVIKSSDGIMLTEYTMEYLEDIGLIKMDFLGIKNLSIIKNILDDIEIGEGKKITFNNIPLNDVNTLKIFREGDTVGIFQFESEGMKKFLVDLNPQSFDDICAAIALYRPGPAENIPLYIKRKNGMEKIDYIDDSLKDILESTYGIIVYQEQIMLIAQRLANYTLGEADILRRAMSKKKLSILKQEEDKFIEKAIDNGYSSDVSKKVYDLILKFANYGFNKSHSVCYSIIAYKMAYLKYYYPKYFYSNLLMGVIGSEVKTEQYLKCVKKLGLKVLPPSINYSSSSKFEVKKEGILFPLSSIRNVGSIIANYIVDKRGDGYTDIYDFLIKTYEKTNNRKVIESLIYSHCLDCFYNINTLINNLDEIINYVDLVYDLNDNSLPKPEIVYYDELSIDDILEHEKSLFGFYLTSHKTEKFKLNNLSISDVSDLKNKLGKVVNLILNVDKKREIITKKNELMCFIEGSDNTGSISLTLFPNLYSNNKNINKNDIIKVTGKVEKRFNDYQVVCTLIEK